MASGDAERTWFPEMIAILQREWNSSMPWEELIALRDRLDAVLQAIRSERNILPSVMRCPRCNAVGRSAPPRVSVRALLLALERFRIAPKSEVKVLEKAWKQYSKRNSLNLYGKTIGEQEGHPPDVLDHLPACGRRPNRRLHPAAGKRAGDAAR